MRSAQDTAIDEMAKSVMTREQLLDRLAKAEELIRFVAAYTGWDIKVLTQTAQDFLASQKGVQSS